jgi:hypothetical protein
VTAPDWARSSNATQAPAGIADEELAAILRRAAMIGIPAWRVTVALGLPPPDDSPP